MRSRDILLPILSLSFPILRIFSFYIFYRIISRCSRSKLIYNTVNFSASSSDISICIFSLQIISIPLFSRISNNSLFLQYNVFIFITPLIRCRRFYCYFDIAICNIKFDIMQGFGKLFYMFYGIFSFSFSSSTFLS